MSRSSRPLSQCSLNGVHPMPTMATLSLMPWELMGSTSLLRCGSRGGGSSGSADRLGLPEVVGDAVGAVEAAEGHLDAPADGDVGGVDVGELDRQAAAAVEVDDRKHDGRARRVGEPIDGEG